MQRVRIIRLLLVTACFVGLISGVVLAQVGPKKVVLPEMPKRWELSPGLFDQNDCMVLPEGPKCGPPPSVRLKQPESTSTEAYRHLRGFKGPLYSSVVTDKEVRVLTDTISTSTTGEWTAMGLVQNQFNREISVQVTASLFDAGGNLLAKRSTSVMVGRLRPGEPGPFEITSAIPVSDVARVDWSAEALPVAGDTNIRDLLIMQHWERPFTASSLSGSSDSTPAYKLLVGFENWSHRSVRNPQLVVAWMSEEKRVIWLERLNSSDTPDTVLPRLGGDFDILAITDQIIGPRLYGVEKLMWVVAE